MKALVYHGPRQVSVDNVDEPKVQKPTDALVMITSTNICGSDLHMYEGRTDFEEGWIFGHENVGEVVEVGEGAPSGWSRRIRIILPGRSLSASPSSSVSC